MTGQTIGLLLVMIIYLILMVGIGERWDVLKVWLAF